MLFYVSTSSSDPFLCEPPLPSFFWIAFLCMYVCPRQEQRKFKRKQNETEAAMCMRDPFNQHHAQDGCRIDGMLILPRPVLQHSQTNSLLAIDPAEVAVPANGYDIGKQDAMLKRQEGKVDCLNNGPHQPVGLQGRPPRLLEALFGTGTLHGGHAAEESANHDGSKQRLVASDAGESFNSRVPKVDIASQESEPGCGDRAKDASTIESHATRPSQVMAFEAPLLNQLLRRDITSCKEHSRSHTLGEKRTGSQSGIVPTKQRHDHCDGLWELE